MAPSFSSTGLLSQHPRGRCLETGPETGNTLLFAAEDMHPRFPVQGRPRSSLCLLNRFRLIYVVQPFNEVGPRGTLVLPFRP